MSGWQPCVTVRDALQVGRIFSQLGYERKAAFFAREVAQMYEQQESRFAAISAFQVLALSAPTYKVQSLAAEPPPLEEVCQGTTTVTSPL